MENFIPYYETIKLGGHAACALAGAYFGGAATFLFSRVSGRGMGLSACFAFALFASSAVWIIPEYAAFKGAALLWAGLAILLLCFPALVLFCRDGMKKIIELWAAFAVAQFVLLSIIYLQMAK